MTHDDEKVWHKVLDDARQIMEKLAPLIVKSMSLPPINWCKLSEKAKDYEKENTKEATGFGLKWQGTCYDEAEKVDAARKSEGRLSDWEIEAREKGQGPD